MFYFILHIRLDVLTKTFVSIVAIVFTVTVVTISGLMCMFSLTLILIDWYNTWDEPMERVDMYM